MDRRVFLAVVLTAIVIVVTPLLFPSMNRPVASDSSRSGVSQGIIQGVGRAKQGSTESRVFSKLVDSARVVAPAETAEIHGTSVSDTLKAGSAHMTVWYSSELGTPLRVVLADYTSRNPESPGRPVALQTATPTALFSYRLLLGDTILPLGRANLVGGRANVEDLSDIEFHGVIGGHSVSIEYGGPKKEEERYLTQVLVRVDGAPADARLAVELPSGLASAEADTADDIRHLAFGYKPAGSGVESLLFSKLDSGVTNSVSRPIEWVAVRDKYFLVAIISPDSSIALASFTGAARVGKLAPRAIGNITFPIRNGRVAFDVYSGPQEFERLQALGHELDRVNPYAGWLHGAVQPFATLVTRVLLWMKHTSGLSYGWVIIIFGVAVRLLLWPLNQSAMRTSIRMQRLQPELTEVQRRYKNDPEKQRDALVKLYQAHGMTPFSPMMGCLPMLLPMPILFALYFVFLNTIEFRGVSFLWMHDISAADPYFITPLVMGISMFALSWIGMRGTPPTAQTRTMSYMMPVVLTFMFFRFAAGLNLYYAVQNLAALPQQWLLARERAGLNVKTKPGDRG